jgi:Secretion system C-terminal sorting domain
MVLPALSTTIISTIPVVPGNPLGGNYPITGYIFEIKNVTTNQVVELPTVTNKFNLTQTNIFAYDTYYDIRVRAIVNGEEQAYQGTVRRLKTPALASPLLLTSQCDTLLPTIGTVIFSQSVLGATDYEFTLTSTAFTSPSTQAIVKQVNKFALSMMPNYTPAYNTEYFVSVRVKVAGAWSNAGTTTCKVTTPAIPTTQLVATQCPATLTSLSATLTAVNVAYATQYMFKISKVDAPGTFDEKIVIGNPLFQLNNMTAVSADYETAYNVWVKVGTATGWGNYGSSPCIVTTPLTPSVNIVTGPGLTGDCENGFHPASNTTTISTTTYPGARYRFYLKGYNGNTLVYDQYVERTVNNVTLSLFPTIPSTPGYTFYMSVGLKLGAVVVLPKEECLLVLPGMARDNANAGIVKVNFSATAYPNPFANNFVIDVKTRNESAVSVKVYDMIGRLIEQRSVSVSDLETSPIGDNYPSGVYNVIVTQDEEVRTLRVVKR